MDEDTRAFAQRMVDASWRDWSTWLTTRMNDIARLEHGVKVAAFRVLEGASRIEDLEHSVARLQRRLEDVRANCHAVAALRIERAVDARMRAPPGDST